ncbi:MAG: peptide deformylase [Candidatus Omnitrophota bacterium]
MKEDGLKIKILGDPLLRRRSRPIKSVSERHRKALSQMAQLMYESSGIGLAAPQVGIGERMIVVDIGNGLYKLINPRIVMKQGCQAVQEGCLSVPGACIKVKRSRTVRLEALDENAKPVCVEAKDLLACVLQHEIDHLDGKLIVDYVSLLERLKIRRRLEGLSKNIRNEELPKSEPESRKL